MADMRTRKRKKFSSDPVTPDLPNLEACEKPKPSENDNCAVADSKIIDASDAPPIGKNGKLDKEFSPPLLPNGGEESAPKKLDQEQRSQSSGSVETGSVKKKRKPRRPKRRKRYKPYHKLTFEEKQELAERETKRAEKFRAERFAHGHAMAPYNTTQFLLEDREARNLEPDVDALVADSLHPRESRERTYSGTASFDSEGSSETASSAGVSDYSGFERDFEVEYESVKAERLESMTKDTLIHDYIGMEQDLERSRVESKELRDMVNRLRKENANLRTKLANSGVLPRPNSAPAHAWENKNSSGRRVNSLGPGEAVESNLD